jgi:hypothetical protein
MRSPVLQQVFKPQKTFTPEEASKTLPLVKRIAQDIARVSREWNATRQERLESLQEGRVEHARELESRAEELCYQIEDYVQELEQLGCISKDPLRGLVDFPARLSGRTVFLCWRLGEEEVLHWHEVEAGYLGRMPVRGFFDKRGG